MSRTTTGGLLPELQALLKIAVADLTAPTSDAGGAWAAQLRGEYDTAFARGRTGLSWTAWRDGEVAQAGVAWVLATVFVRFSEDNDLLSTAWISGPGPRRHHAIEAESAFFQDGPARGARDWLREGFHALAATPAGRGVLDPHHNPVWAAPLGADACQALLDYWRAQDEQGALRRDLTDPTWDTRFLGDLYQDLSEYAKKQYALLQTPVFVEEFILDQTLTPALAEFGLDGLRLIDPTCGSGHFLLGAFDRLLAAWTAHAPGMDQRERVQRALDSIHGVDLNPFAVAIARFRLTVAAMRAAGTTRLADAPAFDYHVAIGDSLLAGHTGRQGDLLDDNDGAATFQYATEDIADHPHLLERGRYHVVVGNPPYITVKDKALNELYRQGYPTCAGKYALSVPFAELFFELAQRGDTTRPAGYVGQITSNSFMKREFGKKLIESFLSGANPTNPVDLTTVIDTSGAYIPGHGTPTVILVGRRRRPVGDTVRAVLGVRGEPGQPDDPAKGLAWTDILEHLDLPGYDGIYVSVADLARSAFATHPWSLSGGGAGELKEAIDDAGQRQLASVLDGVIGFASFPGTDDAFFVGAGWFRRHSDSADLGRELVTGDVVRDWSDRSDQVALTPYDAAHQPVPLDLRATWARHLWNLRTVLGGTTGFGGVTRSEAGDTWWTWYRWIVARYETPMSLAFAEVATHIHVVLDRGGKVFKQTAPVIKLPAGASEDEHLDLLGVLNSSTACFWLKQVCHNKGSTLSSDGARTTLAPWEDFYQFNSSKWQEFPLPVVLPRERARLLDGLAQQLTATSPAAALARGDVSLAGLDTARAEWERVRAAMVFAQEELDWEVYRAYGLIDDDLTYAGDDLAGIVLGQRAFEIALARRIAAGAEESAWFERHGSTPITELPDQWPAAYRELVQRRLDLIQSDPRIGLLERPEYKRRWASRSWEELERDALTSFVLDRLEAAELWRDGQGPRVLSVAGLADLVKRDESLIEALRLLTGDRDVDVTAALRPLVRAEAVPYLAAWRYKPSGMVKRAEWEAVWDLQRREDAGEKVAIPVPPKYAQADFRRSEYWTARGKLDVPKERFVLYPGAGRDGDPTEVLGWAGWDHAAQAQAQALARLLVERAGESWDTEQLRPLLAGLVELQPWLDQWHTEVDPAFGVSPAAAIRALIDQQLAQRGLTVADVKAWEPPAPTRGRRRSTGSSAR